MDERKTVYGKDILADIKKKTLYAVAKKTCLEALTHVYIEVKDGVLSATATNGSILAHIERETFLEDFTGLISPKDLKESVKDGDDAVYIEYDRQKPRFPAYKRLKPETFEAEATIDRRSIIKAINDIKTSSSGVRVLVEINGSGGTVEKGNESGWETSNFVAKSDSPIELAVNYKYILDTMRSMDCKDVIMQFSGELKPLVIRENVLASDYVLVMPMRMD